MKSKTIKTLFEIIDNTNRLEDIELLGSVRDYYESTNIYNSTDSAFSTIIITTMTGSNCKKISFTGVEFKVSLKELKDIFGGYDFAYNFRDNYTGFFFNVTGKKVFKVFCEKDNNFKIEHNYFCEYSPTNKLFENLREEEILFDNIFFEVKL